MTKIILHQRQMPIYQVGIMARFCERFPDAKILFGAASKFASLKNAEINNPKFLKRRWFYPTKRPTVFFAPIFFLLLRLRPKVIITEGSVGNLTIPFLVFLRPFLGFKIILWGHGWDRMKGIDLKNSRKDRYRLSLQKWSDALVFYSHSAKDGLSSYLPASKMFVANNTIDSVEPGQIFDRLKTEGRDSVKKRLNFKAKVNLVYLGRITSNKNLMLLLDLSSEMQGRDFELHFIGSGNALNDLEERSRKEKLTGVRFHGQISEQEKIGELLFACDLMFIPGKVGLSVVHSFNFGLPVIVFDSNEHSPEIDFVKHEENGMILQEHSLTAIQKVIDMVTEDESKLERLRLGARKTVETTVNTNAFLDGFEGAIQYVLKENETDSSES